MFQQDPIAKEQVFFKRLPSSPDIVLIGHLVRSIKGRDRGKYYLVIGRDGLSRIQVADGEVRKVENPKYKNIKHLIVYDAMADELSAKAESGKRITNVDVRQGLKSLIPA